MSFASVTAVITTHNRADQLGAAIDSVLAQTHPADEIIVVNDGSTDDTDQLLEQYATQVQIIKQQNRGISAARNRAIKKSHGQWLAFLDDDDAWLPHKLEKQLMEVQQQPDIRLCHGDEIWIRNGKRVNAMNKHQKFGGKIYEHCLPRCVISPSCVMIRRDLFDDIGTFDESLPACEDYDLWLRICAHEPVCYIDEPLITKYGGHPDQLSRKYWGMDRFRVTALEKQLMSGALNPTQQQLTQETLIEKLEILINGSRKRNKREELNNYQARLDKALEQFNHTTERRSCC